MDGTNQPADGQQGARPSNKRLQQTQAQVDEVVGIMKVNVEKVLERDQKLSQLDDRADALQEGASQFEKSAATLKRKYWWKNIKMIIIMCAIVLLLVIIIVVWADGDCTIRGQYGVIPCTSQSAQVKANYNFSTAFKVELGRTARGRRYILLERSRLSTPTHEGSESASVSPNFSLYTAYARQICQHIRELADLVLERRKSYLLTSVNVYGHDNFMTDDDRRQFDSDTDLAMKQCSRLVRNLEFQLDNDQSLRGEDEYAHLKAITLLLNVYLKNVCKIVTELRSVHLKKTQYLNRICRLGNLVSMCGAKIDKRRLHDQQIKDQKQKELPKSSSFANMIRSVSSNSLEGKTFDGLKSDRLVSQPKDEPEKLDFDTADDQYPEDEAGEAHDVDLKPSEQAQLTAENQHLLERFIQRNSEIEQIETQFADLQKLQQTFIEKVVEQEKDIEIIHEKTIYTLDNLDQANDFIREAIKNSASRRVIALFCLIVLTFTLLFLDWYNP